MVGKYKVITLCGSTRFKDQFKDSPDMVRNVSPDVLPESYRVKLKDPTQFAQVHDLFCSGTFNDRGKEICNPGIDSVIDQKKLVERLFVREQDQRTAALDAWLEHYNTARSHSALGGHPPISRLAA